MVVGEEVEDRTAHLSIAWPASQHVLSGPSPTISMIGELAKRGRSA
jgi:hypothetical protein